jgi:hypothetical protein
MGLLYLFTVSRDQTSAKWGLTHGLYANGDNSFNVESSTQQSNLLPNCNICMQDKLTINTRSFQRIRKQNNKVSFPANLSTSTKPHVTVNTAKLGHKEHGTKKVLLNPEAMV